MTDHNYLIEKIKQFCDYQERCISDVKNKLSEWNVQPAKIEKIILELQKTDFINEERYAKAYASGKFRIKKWGKNKIIYELYRKQIPDLYIQIGLHEINDEDYLKTLKEIISKKEAEIKETSISKRNNKLAAYTISKGYSRGIVWKVLNAEK
ncbi:MAG: RecX family transcriptional regulator [Bacteroidales bacterium]|jgi:regulatory protein|nr:RecX family transcriptional regulator [Bacteroidales bacterium]MCK4638359.1 RecX family transcriptional regulator [Bacteroidales bacterium]